MGAFFKIKQMKIIVVSDIHGRLSLLSDILEEQKDASLIICLGDLGADRGEIELIAGSAPCVFVKGNCDYFSLEPEYRIIPANGKRIYAAHGHRENVKYSLDVLKYKASLNKADIALFGHTHAPRLEKDGDILVINPGAVCNGNYCVISIENGAADAKFY